MIPRYTRPEMGRIWSDENKFRCWLQVETAASLTLAEAGLVPEEAAQAIAERGDFDVRRIHEIEAEVKHDVIAFTTAVAEKVGPEARWLQACASWLRLCACSWFSSGLSALKRAFCSSSSDW